MVINRRKVNIVFSALFVTLVFFSSYLYTDTVNAQNETCRLCMVEGEAFRDSCDAQHRRCGNVVMLAGLIGGSFCTIASAGAFLVPCTVAAGSGTIAGLQICSDGLFTCQNSVRTWTEHCLARCASRETN